MGKINAYDKIMFAKQDTKQKISKSKKFFYINLHPQDSLKMEFTAC